MTTTAILGLLAQTSIHAGTGSQTGGIIDLPIQREGHTNYPCVFGSAVKGSLRNKAESLQQKEIVCSVYGSEHGNEASSGAIIVSDARLLLLPVRSLTSQFKWVTCPYLLLRYQEDRARLGKNVTFTIPSCEGESQALVHNTNTAGDLFLEEYRFTTQTEDLSQVISALAQLIQRDDTDNKLTAALQTQLVIVSDDSFTHLSNHATPVNAHIVLSATKTSENLWYEETLPPETLLYLGISANVPRKEKPDLTAAQVLEKVVELFQDKPYLQLGGNETVGMGWCIVKPLGAE